MAWSPPPPRAGHPYYMHDAIRAQPEAIRRVLADNRDPLREAAARLRGLERLLLAGIGTSWHATLVGELALATLGGLGNRVRALHSFEFSHYWPAPEPGSGLIVVSHRGTKRYSLEALAKAREAGAVTVAITGKGSGDGIRLADVVLSTVEQEASAAHTISYTTAMALLAALAAELGGAGAAATEVERLSDLMAAMIEQEPAVRDLAARFKDRQRYYFIGGGPNTATAYEAALKMSEANYATALGFNAEQVLHGPWVAMDAEDLVVVIAPPGPAYERCLALARVAREVGTPVVALVEEGDREIAGLAAAVLPLPRTLEPLTPIPAVLPLQLFTYHLALLRGANPDSFRAEDPAHAQARAAYSL